MKFKKIYSMQMMFGFGMLMGMFGLPESLPFVNSCIIGLAVFTAYNAIIEVFD